MADNNILPARPDLFLTEDNVDHHVRIRTSDGMVGWWIGQTCVVTTSKAADQIGHSLQQAAQRALEVKPT